MDTARRAPRLALVAALLASGAPTAQAEIALYETGPAEDAAFLRFVDAAGVPLEAVAAGGKSRSPLDAANPATAFYPVKARTDIRGDLVAGATRAPIDLQVAPGEFVTVVAVPGSGGTPGVVVVREKPTDFNAAKASVALVSLDPTCTAAGLKVADRAVALVENVPTGQVARRSINPVPLKVRLVCGGAERGEPLDLGTLAPGARYTVFAPPGGRPFAVTDRTGR